PSTAVFKLATPYAPFLSLLAEGQYLWIFPREVDGGFDPTKEQIGTGPFMLDEAQPDVSVTFRRNPNYFLTDQPHIDSIQRVFIADLAQQNAQFQAERLDYHNVRFEARQDLARSNPNARIIEYLGAGVGTIIAMQQKGNSPFKDVRVRRAVSLAFDRESWGEIYYSGQKATPANVLPPTFPKFYLDPTTPEAGPGAQWTKYDPKAARELLRAAGAENQSVRFVYTNNGYGTVFNSSAEATIGMLKEAGFNLNVLTQDYLREFIEPTRGSFFGNYEGILYGIPAPYSEPHFFLATHYHSKGARFLPGVADPRMDEMVEQQARTLDVEERIKIIHEFQRYELDQMYYVPTGAGPQYLFLQPWVKGYNYAFEGWGSHIAESAIHAWIDRS
ncbi:MAG: ABC transporter substrate-binding protein, partial [Dehalococcoidia bacterium]